MRDIVENGRLTWRLMNDPRVSSFVKVAIPMLVALYLFFPIDFIPDLLPVLGQLDDIGVVLFGMSMIVRFSPKSVVDEHRRALGLDAASGVQFDPTKGDKSSNPWAEPPVRTPGEPTRPIDGEYTVVTPKSNGSV